MKLLLSMCLLLSLASLTLGQCSESDKQTLEKFDHAWTDANARGDRAYLETVYADDYSRTSLTGPASKKEIIDAAVRSAEEAKANPQSASKVTADHFIITCTPNTATITHRTVVTSIVRCREQTFYSRGVHFLEKRNGSWKVVSLANHPLDDSTNLLMIQREWNEVPMNKVRRLITNFDSPSPSQNATDVGSSYQPRPRAFSEPATRPLSSLLVDTCPGLCEQRYSNGSTY